MPWILDPENGPPRRALAVGNDPENGIRLDNARDAQVHPFPLASRLLLAASAAVLRPARSPFAALVALPSFP